MISDRNIFPIAIAFSFLVHCLFFAPFVFSFNNQSANIPNFKELKITLGSKVSNSKNNTKEIEKETTEFLQNNFNEPEKEKKIDEHIFEKLKSQYYEYNEIKEITKETETNNQEQKREKQTFKTNIQKGKSYGNTNATIEEIKKYTRQLPEHILQFLQYPEKINNSNIIGTAQIIIEIKRDGTLLNAILSKKTGSDILDKAMIKAIYDASPMVAVPANISPSKQKLAFKFEMSFVY